MPDFTLGIFVENVGRLVRQFLAEDKNLFRCYFGVIGADFDIKSWSICSYRSSGIGSKELYAAAATHTLQEFWEDVLDTRFLATTVAMPGTDYSAGGQKKLCDLIIAVERAGDSYFGITIREPELRGGSVPLDGVPPFAVHEAAMLRRYLEGQKPKLVTVPWIGVGTALIDPAIPLDPLPADYSPS